MAFIKKSITELINNDVEASKIALILPDESFSSTISLFDNEEYFNYAMGLNIYTTNLYKYIDAIYLYLNDDEIKNRVNLEFIEIDQKVINTLFKSNWNKVLTIELFEEIIEFLLKKRIMKS